MKRQCFCARHWRLALGLVLVPLLLWCALLTLLPTQFARTRIAERLSHLSGRAVRIGALEVGPLGGVRLKNLQIGAPTTSENPWLTIQTARFNINLIHLIVGKFEPTQVVADGMDLRLLRRKDGSLELADFLQPAQIPATTAASPHETHAISLVVHNAELQVRDEPTGTQLDIHQLEAKASCDGIVTNLNEMHGRLNAGSIRMAARFDRSGAKARFEGQVRARDVVVDGEMRALGYLLPVVSTIQDQINQAADGRLALDLYLEGEGNSREALQESLKGQGRVDIDPILLKSSTMLMELARVLDIPKPDRLGSASGDFQLHEGRVSTENLTLSVNKVPLVFTGWTDFHENVRYRLKADKLGDRIPESAREYLNEFDLNLRELANIEVQGTLGAPRVTVDGLLLVDPSGKTAQEGRLREIGRRLRDRIRR